MRLVNYDEPEMPPAAIPFPGPYDLFQRRTPGRDDNALDSVRMAEEALDRLQRGVDELAEALSPIPFRVCADDDGPRAA